MSVSGFRGSRTPLLRKRLYVQPRTDVESQLGVPESADDATQRLAGKPVIKTASKIGRDAEFMASLGEQARDVQSALDTIPITLFRELSDVYTEPMTIGALPAEPLMIEVVRVRIESDLEKPVRCGQAVHWVWDKSNNLASIRSIDGLDAETGVMTRYRYLFRISYPADVEVL